MGFSISYSLVQFTFTIQNNFGIGEKLINNASIVNENFHAAKNAFIEGSHNGTLRKSSYWYGWLSFVHCEHKRPILLNFATHSTFALIVCVLIII